MTIRRAFGSGSLLGAALLSMAGCRRPTPGFVTKAAVPAALIERAVMLAPVPGNPQSGYYETRDPRLIARHVETRLADRNVPRTNERR